MINRQCPETYKDYIHGKEAEDGRKLKERVKDADTGIRYEKYHHITDANDYFLLRLFKSEFNAYIRGGKRQQRGAYKNPGKGVFKRR